MLPLDQDGARLAREHVDDRQPLGPAPILGPIHYET
jgi:hypothetical protein